MNTTRILTVIFVRQATPITLQTTSERDASPATCARLYAYRKIGSEPVAQVNYLQKGIYGLLSESSIVLVAPGVRLQVIRPNKKARMPTTTSSSTVIAVELNAGDKDGWPDLVGDLAAFDATATATDLKAYFGLSPMGV